MTRYMGPGSRFQMYCSLILAGTLVYQADASANMMEVAHVVVWIFVSSDLEGELCGGEVLIRRRICGLVVLSVGAGN